jgi:hypothetical protein
VVYSWFHAPLERLMLELLRRAIEVGQQQDKRISNAKTFG